MGEVLPGLGETGTVGHTAGGLMKRALIDYRRCDPARCPEGICAAARACERRLLKQEAAFEVPMPGALPCSGCGDCVRGCPLEAVKIVADG